ncbi:MAG: FadR family transcriptional regulator [Methylocystaceae bacterium]|nr:FadR family transcriptional regulator [Methylocystaceae bacterium]
MRQNKFKKLEIMPAYRLVADAIEKQIMTGQIKPEDPIGTEADLVEQFGVNRSTVREGIRLLEQSGMLRRGEKRRLYVSLPGYDKLATRISRSLVLHKVTFRELVETLEILEPTTIALAAKHITEEQLERLRINVAATEKELEDRDRLSQLDTEFHSIIAEAAHNSVFLLAREPAGLLIYPATQYIFEAVPEAPSRLLEAHKTMLQALEERDEEKARVWMDKHVRDFVKGLVRSGAELDGQIAQPHLAHLLSLDTYL